MGRVALGGVLTLLTLEIIYRLVALPPEYGAHRHEAALPVATGVVASLSPLGDVRITGVDESATLALSRHLDVPYDRAATLLPEAVAVQAAATDPPAEPAGDALLVLDLTSPEPSTTAALSPPPPAAAPLGRDAEAGLDAGVLPVALPVVPRPPLVAPRGGDAPLVAIIIDDLGYSPAAVRRLVAMPGPMTMAFLPNAEATPDLLALAARRGFELMLHLPMEPLGDANQGPDALLVNLGESGLRQRIRGAIARVPGAVGVNNHMGSRFTADPRGLEILMDELRQRGLFFVDSRTNSRSVAERMALAAGIPAIGRDIFIDHDPEPSAILRQFAAIERIARRSGSVVAIGHPYPSTLAALEAWLPSLVARGFRLARSSEVLAKRLCADAGRPCGPALQLAAQDAATSITEPEPSAGPPASRH